MYTNLKLAGYGDFRPGIVYWTSSQSSGNPGLMLTYNFDAGGSTNYITTNSYPRVRAVRSF